MTAGMRRIGPRISSHWPAVAIFAGVIVLWQLAVSFLGLREYLLPSPMAVLRAMFGDELSEGVFRTEGLDRYFGPARRTTEPLVTPAH